MSLAHRAAVAMGEHNVVGRVRRVLEIEESAMRPSGKLVVLVAIVLLAPALMLAVRAGEKDSAESPTEPGRILRFPADRSLGIVYTRPRRPEGYDARNRWGDWARRADARGDVRVPADVDVSLDVSRTATADLSSLSQLDPNDIDFLRVQRTEVDESALMHIAHLRGLKDLDMDGTGVAPAGFRHLRTLTQLRNIDLDGHGTKAPRRLGDEVAAVLAELPLLEFVVLRRTDVGDGCLARLAGMKSLRSLSVGGTRVTDVGLTHVRKMANLESLSLGVYKRGCDITDEGLRIIGQMTRLRSLDLSGTRVSDGGLAHLRNLRRLEHLNIEHTMVTEAGFAHLEPLSMLGSLRFDGRVTDVGARHLSKLPSLERLVNFDLHISDEGLAALLSLPRLKDLPLRYEIETEANLARLTTTRRLERLHLSGDAITDEGMRHLAKMTWLKDLRLEHVAVTDEGLASLAPLKSLERLMLEANKVTGVGLRHIAGHTALKDLTLRLEREPMTLNSLGTLTGLETLRIDAHWLRLPDEELANLTPLKNLQTLSLDRCRIGDRGVAHLAHLTGLRELDLSGTRVTDDGLAFLRGLRNLRSLHFVGAITERGLDHIAALPALEELRIGSYLPLSDEAVAGLAERMPSLKRAQNTSPRQTMSLNDGLLRRGRRDQRGPFDALEGRAAPALKVREWVNAGDDPPRLDRLRGNVVLLGFWGPRNTWARHIVPRLNEVRDRYAGDGLVVLGIHATNAPKQVVGMVDTFDVSWPVALDRKTATFRAYGVQQGRLFYPSFYLIDRRGTLRVADLYWEDINRAVEMFLAEPRPPL